MTNAKPTIKLMASSDGINWRSGLSKDLEGPPERHAEERNGQQGTRANGGAGHGKDVQVHHRRFGRGLIHHRGNAHDLIVQPGQRKCQRIELQIFAQCRQTLR